jgi:hypothetical protein
MVRREATIIGKACRIQIVSAENLCHQTIFVHYASRAVSAKDAEAVQVGDAIRQRAKRRGLVEGAVWPVRVAEVLVLAQTVIRCRWFQALGTRDRMQALA